jgi:hypothetical protein
MGQKINAKEVATDLRIFGAPDLDNTLKEIKGQKFMDFFNVKNFGAKGDGVTDDTEAIQEALDKAAQEGKPLYFPTGTYNTGSLYLDGSNTTIEGITIFSNGKAKLKQVNPGNVHPERNILTFQDVNNIEIWGLELDGSYFSFDASLPSNTTNHGIALYSCKNVKIHDCYIHHTGWPRTEFDKFGDHIYCRNGENIQIYDNKFYMAGRWTFSALEGNNYLFSNNLSIEENNDPHYLGFIDFELSPGTPELSQVTINNNVAIGNTCLNFSGQGGFDNVEINNNILNGYDLNGVAKKDVSGTNYVYGITLVNANNLIINNNLVRGGKGSGIRAGVTDRNAYNVNINNNIIDGEYANGIDIKSNATYQVENFSITGNKVIVDSASGRALEVEEYANKGTIANNYLEATGSFSIVSAANDVTIAGNTFDGTTHASIGMFSNVAVIGNSFNTCRLSPQKGSTGSIVTNNKGNYYGIYGAITEFEGVKLINPFTNKATSTLALDIKPVSGFFSPGDRIYNSSPSAGGTLGWLCVNRQDTAVRVEAASGATTIEVDSTAGIATGDIIGIRLDDDSIDWTTVAEITDTDTLTITETLTSPSAVGNEVYTTRLKTFGSIQA